MGCIYHPMHMHIHTCYQPGGSMEAHIHNAASLGMHYIRFTDHDTRIGLMELRVREFDFSRGTLVYRDEGCAEVGWKPVGEPVTDLDGGKLTLVNRGETTSTTGIEFYSSGKNHAVTMLSEVTLTLDCELDVSGDAYAAIDIRMSQRPPEHKYAHLCYYVGNKPSSAPHTAYLPLPEAVDGVVTLRLSDDLRTLPEIGGLDNALDTVMLVTKCREGGTARITARRMTLENIYYANDVVERQRALAEEIGARYGVKPFVTSEISGAGQHKNCFSTSVPIIDYHARDYKVSEKEAIDHVKKHGGIFAYNHPFENKKYKKMTLTKDEVDREVELEAANLIACRALGATLMEVGFVEGRGVFTLGDHLRLWDFLSLSGIFITGYGDSDSHFSSKGWFSGNNFASWIAAPEAMGLDVSEATFTDSMKAGRVYMGDPVYLKSSISFTADGYQMGSVFYDTKTHKCSFKTEKVEQNCKICVIENGRCIREQTVENGGDVELSFDSRCESGRSVSFVRVEMYNADGRCIMLTNPIYFADPDRLVPDIPTERLVPSFDERVSGEYPDPIELPPELYTIKGKRVLHIGDTESRYYPYFKKLIEEVKPDVIIHTGDMSDEVKVGRIPGTKNEYISKIKVIAGAMRESNARLIVVPGNNDLEADIKTILPEAEVLPVNSIVEIDGIECRVGHQVNKMSFDRKWHFYGHGFTGEEWEYEMNLVRTDIRRFNACLGAFVCSPSEDIFALIKLPKLAKNVF